MIKNSGREESRIRGIGIVAPTPGSKSGDSGHVATRMMVDTFSKMGIDTYLFTRDTVSDNFGYEGKEVKKINKPYANSKYIFRLIGLIIYHIKICYHIYNKKNSISLIITGGWGLVLPILLCRLLSIKSLHRVGGKPLNNVKGIDRRGFIPSRLKLLTAKIVLIANYEFVNNIAILSESLKKEYFYLDKKSKKIITWDHYNFSTSLIKVTKEFENRQKTIGYVGMINEDKGVPELLTAAIKICKKYQDVSFLFIGRGPYMHKAKHKIEKEEVGNAIRFSGYIERDKIPEYLNNMSLFVLPSKHEGLPKVVMEAMGCGTPVLARSVGGIPDIIEDKKNGFLIYKTTKDVIFDNIISIFKNNELNKVSKKSRDTFVKRYGKNNTMHRYKQMIRKVFDDKICQE